MENNNNSSVSDEALFADAFARLEAEMAALEEKDLVPINIDVPSAVTTSFGVLPKLREHRKGLETIGAAFDLERLDKLEDYTMALSHAHARYWASMAPPDDLAPVYEEASDLRELLQSDMNSLVRRGLLPQDSLDDLTGNTGYKNVATDLQILSIVLEENWAKIEGKTAIEKKEVEHGAKLAARILRVVGKREQSPATAAVAADQRSRAFALFLRAYDDARRAIIFLRWHAGDADTIAPSLFSGRGNTKKKGQQDAPAPAGVATSVSAPVTGGPTAAATPANAPGGIVIPTSPPAATDGAGRGPFG